MSLGDLVISLSANTARFESDMGKASQLVERWGNSVGNSAVKAEQAIAKMSSVGITSVDRLQQSFNSLNIKSGLQIDKEAANIQAAFERIKGSGVASADEIRRANVAMKSQLDTLKNGNVMKGHIKGMNGFSLASVAAIAKIQIMYSLINNVMSAIGSMPGKAIDAIENYNTSIVTNAALITSMAGGTKDIGAAYRENKVYAEAVEKVLVRMDTETSASYEQLQIMNRAYMQQGVYLDINNQKAIEGRRNTANALAVIAQATPNPNMQFGQEIRGLMNGTMKEGNALLKMLVGIDKDVVEKIERWKKAGSLDENIGKLLVGFAAAQGDIDNMWATVKSTMATIRDEVLRGGLAPAFGEIVAHMKDINKWADANKEKIQKWLSDGFSNAKVAAEYMWNLGKALSYFTEPAKYVAIAASFAAIATGISKINVALLATPIGRISALIGLAATATAWGIGKYGESLDNNQAATDVRASAVGGKGVGSVELAKQREYMAQFNAGAFEQVKAKFPMMNNETIGMLLKNKGIELQSEVAGVYGELATTVIFNEAKIKKLLEGESPVVPKPGKGSVGSSEIKLSDRQKAMIQGSKDLIKDAWQQAEIELAAEDFSRDMYKKLGLVGQGPWAAKPEGFTKNPALSLGMDLTLTSLEFQRKETERIAAIEKERASNAKKDATEQRNFAIEKLQDELMIIDMAEKMDQISGPDALAKRIPLEQQIASIQKSYLSEIPANDNNYFKQNMIYMQAMKVVADDMKKAFDATAKGGMSNAIQKYGEDATNVGKQIESVFTNAFKNIEDSIVKAFQTGKFSAKDMIQSIAADVVRMQIAKPLTGAIAGLFAPGQSTKVGADGYISQSATSGGALAGAAPFLAVAAIGYSIVDSFIQSDKARKQEHDAAIKMQKEINASILSTKQGLTGDIYASQMTDLLTKQEAFRNSTYETLDKSTNANGTLVGRILTGSLTSQDIAALNVTGSIADVARLKETWDLLLETQQLEREQLIAKQNQTTNNLRLQEMELLKQKDSAAYIEILTSVREAEMFGLDKTAQVIQRRIFALQDEQAAVEKVSKAISKTVDVALSAANAIKSIQGGSLSTDSPEQKYAKAMAAFISNTDNSKAGELGQAALSASQSYNASGAGYQTDYAVVMAKLNEVAGIIGTTTADEQITLLTSIRDDITNGTNPLLENLEVGSSVTNIVNTFSTNTATSSEFEAVSQMVSGIRAADLQYDINKDNVIDIRDMLIYKRLAEGLPAFASGGNHSGGLRLVGERGPELEATGASRIWNADQTRGMLLGKSSADKENEELKETNRQLMKIVRVLQAGFEGTIDAVETTGFDRANYNKVRLRAAA